MDANERQCVLDRLGSSRAKVLDAVRGLTLEQWRFRPAEDRWSAADCVEHVVLVETRVLGAIGKMLTKPPQPEKSASVAHKDDLILKVIPNRGRPFQSPEPVRPKTTWPDPNDLMAEFEATRARTIQFASETEGDLRAHFFPHVILEELDCYQWLLLLGPHSERHVAQIEELKACPGFPKSSERAGA